MQRARTASRSTGKPRSGDPFDTDLPRLMIDARSGWFPVEVLSKEAGSFVPGWGMWSERSEAWVTVFQYQGHIWRKYLRRGSKNFREAKQAAPPLVIDLKARAASPWCGADVSGCHCSDPGSEEDPDAGILEPPSDQEDPDFLMARELKYHLELVSPIVGMARKTNMCKCWEPVGNFDYGLSSLDTMGNLCTEVEWWLQDEASQNRYDAVHTNWEKLLAVWDHLLKFHIEDLLDAGFDSDTVKDFLDGCLQYQVGGRSQVKQLLATADTVAI